MIMAFSDSVEAYQAATGTDACFRCLLAIGNSTGSFQSCRHYILQEMPENILGTVRFNRIDTSVCKRVPKDAVPAPPQPPRPSTPTEMKKSASTASLHSVVCWALLPEQG
jgi:hypothetical protein